MELVIDEYVNFKYKVKTKIFQGSPVSLILFLIYISRVSQKIEYQLLSVICLLFIDDLGFLSVSNSVMKIKKILEKTGKTTLDWGTRNAVIYDISKTKAMQFSNTRK